MADHTIRRGMDWVAARLRRLGRGQGVAVRSLGWSVDSADLSRHNFMMLLNGRFEAAAFNDADLEDLPQDPRLQTQVDRELRALLHDTVRGWDSLTDIFRRHETTE